MLGDKSAWLEYVKPGVTIPKTANRERGKTPCPEHIRTSLHVVCPAYRIRGNSEADLSAEESSGFTTQSTCSSTSWTQSLGLTRQTCDWNIGSCHGWWSLSDGQKFSVEASCVRTLVWATFASVTSKLTTGLEIAQSANLSSDPNTHIKHQDVITQYQ